MGFIRAHREQGLLLGNTLEEFVPGEAKCRFVVAFVEELDLASLYGAYKDQGGDAFDPAVMLATWFYAYSEGVTSTRELEDRCQRDLHYIYVSGNLRPDHTSFSRFRQRHLGQLPDYFVQILLRARERGLSEFKRISIDGTKLRANAARKRSQDEAGLDKQLARIRAEIQSYLERSELLDEETQEEDLESVRGKIQRLQALEEKLRVRRRELRNRKKQVSARHQDTHKINVTDPDARQMKGCNGPGYNPQASVDIDSHLIVATDVVMEPNDLGQFSVQHAQAETHLGPDKSREYVADSGYHSMEELEYIEREEVEATIADPAGESRSVGPEHAGTVKEEAQKSLPRGAFVYDKDADTYVCPAGQTLTYWKKGQSHGRVNRIYRAASCGGCALRKRCIGKDSKQEARTIWRDVREDLAEQMFRKSRSEEGRKRLGARAGSVEPVFGNLKSNLGFRQFRLRGIENVRAEFVLMCIGHNLNKMFRALSTLYLRVTTFGGLFWRPQNGYSRALEAGRHLFRAGARTRAVAA